MSIMSRRLTIIAKQCSLNMSLMSRRLTLKAIQCLLNVQYMSLMARRLMIIERLCSLNGQYTSPLCRQLTITAKQCSLNGHYVSLMCGPLTINIICMAIYNLYTVYAARAPIWRKCVHLRRGRQLSSVDFVPMMTICINKYAVFIDYYRKYCIDIFTQLPTNKPINTHSVYIIVRLQVVVKVTWY
jgi:hypothetical protein